MAVEPVCHPDTLDETLEINSDRTHQMKGRNNIHNGAFRTT
jgi:hypothetical protein